MTKLFVYGTLKKGYANHHVLDGAKFVCNGVLPKAVLYSLGGFPGLQRTSSIEDEVVGEIYEIDERVLERCDRLEGHPSFYCRKTDDIFVNREDENDYVSAYYYEYPHKVNEDKRIATF